MTHRTWRRLLATTIVAVVAADWATKFWIRNRIALGDNRTLVDGWLFLAHRENPGISWGWLGDLAGGPRFVLIAGATILSAVVLWQILSATRDRPTWAAGSLVAAGALGNLGDRIGDGRVTDFVLFRPFPYVWNVADAAITVGAILLLWCQLFPRESADRSEPPTDPASI